MSKLDVYCDLRQEVIVRLQQVDRELAELARATDRVTELKAKQAVLLDELAEYNAAIEPLIDPVTLAPKP